MAEETREKTNFIWEAIKADLAEILTVQTKKSLFMPVKMENPMGEKFKN